MKRIAIAAIVVCTIALIAFASDPAPSTLQVICPSTTTPVQVGSSLVHARTLVFMGFNGAGRTTNTSTVWIQTSPANNGLGVPLSPGQIISFTSQRPYDASDFWIDAETANDGAVVLVQDKP